MQVGPEMSKTSLFCRFWELKNHRIHKHSNTCHAFNFHNNFFFLNARNNVSANYRRTIPLTAQGMVSPAPQSTSSWVAYNCCQHFTKGMTGMNQQICNWLMRLTHADRPDLANLLPTLTSGDMARDWVNFPY